MLEQLNLEDTFAQLCRRILRPLGSMLFPHLVGRGDADYLYGFTVRYKADRRQSSSQEEIPLGGMSGGVSGGVSGGGVGGEG